MKGQKKSVMMKKVCSFLVIAAFFAVAVSGSGPSEATDLMRNSARQRGQAITSARRVRGLLSRKAAAGISLDASGAAREYTTDRRDQKAKRHPRDHRKRPSGGRSHGAGELPHVGDRKMMRPPCVTEQECAKKKLFCFKKCSQPMNMQEGPKCLIRCVKCLPTC